MLAGLWGAHNYMNMAMAKKVKIDIGWRRPTGLFFNY